MIQFNINGYLKSDMNLLFWFGWWYDCAGGACLETVLDLRVVDRLAEPHDAEARLQTVQLLHLYCSRQLLWKMKKRFKKKIQKLSFRP